MHHQLVDEQSLTMMTTPRLQNNGKTNPQNYGLGWRSGTMPYQTGGDNLTPIIHHGGTAVGAECALMLTPEFGISVAICGNAVTGASGGLIQLSADAARNFQRAVENQPG